MDSLHIERIHLVGCSYLVTIDLVGKFIIRISYMTHYVANVSVLYHPDLNLRVRHILVI